MPNDNVEPIGDGLEISYFISYALGSLIMLILSALHTYEVMSDLCTKKRKSINHRVSKPDRKRNYKFLQYLTLAVVLVFLGYDLGLFIMFPWSVCQWAPQISCYLVGKCGMYIIFMYRLDIAYKKSAYGYSRRFISVMIILNVVWAVLGPVLTSIALQYVTSIVDDDESPNPCFLVMEGSIVIVPVITFLWDMFMNILSLCLFIIPLRKTLKLMGHTINLNDDTKKNKMTGKMLYLCVKYTVLTSVAAATTIVAMLVLVLVPHWGQNSGAFDVIINSICVMLMTAYYPDDTYYERLCGCCLYLCCPKKLKTYKSRASKGAELRAKDDPSTKDTTQIYQHAMAKRESIQTQQTQTQVTETEATEIQIGQTVTLEPIMDDKDNVDITPEPQPNELDDDSADSDRIP